MKQEEISAAMDALHNEYIELFRKYEALVAAPDDPPVVAAHGFAISFGVAVGGFIAGIPHMPAETRAAVTRALMAEAGAFAASMAAQDRQEPRQ